MATKKELKEFKRAGFEVLDPDDLEGEDYSQKPDTTPPKGKKARKRAARAMEIQATVQRAADRASRYYKEVIEPDQTKATKFYKGELFGDEIQGKSKALTTDVRDTTLQQIPSLLRIFFGPEHTVEFVAKKEEHEELAKLKTEYIEYVVREDNDGFTEILSVLKDGLVRRYGAVKWWYEKNYRIEQFNYERLTIKQLEMLVVDPEVTLIPETLERLDLYEGNLHPELEQLGPLFNVSIERRKKFGCPKFAAIPPEELLYTPGSRRLKQAPFVFHSREVPQDELLQLGIDKTLIEEAIGEHEANDTEDLRFVREPGKSGDVRWYDDEESLDDSQLPVLFSEGYGLVDGNDDGIAELRFFQCVGPTYIVANGDGFGEIVSELPIAGFTPDPEPHTVQGLGNFDMLGQTQRIKSEILRGTLDSLTQAINPMLEIVHGQVFVQDITNPELGNVVRVRQPGMMREVAHRFVGGDTLPVLEYMDRDREAKSGTINNSPGLNADALQSATAVAVAATVSGSQQRLEYIAYVFAETLMKPLFKGLYRLCVEHQDHARYVRLRRGYTDVDPRTWDSEMEVTVNVGLGRGSPEDRITAMSGIVTKLDEFLAKGYPFVNFVHLRKAFTKAIDMSGNRGDDYALPWGMEQQAAFEKQQAESPPPPDPAMEMLKIEGQKVQLQAQKQQADDVRAEQAAQRESEQSFMQAQQQSEKLNADLQVKGADLAVETDRNRQLAQDTAAKLALDEQLAAAKLAFEADIQNRELAFKQQFEAAKLEMEGMLEGARIEIERERLQVERERNAMQAQVAKEQAKQKAQQPAKPKPKAK